MRSPITSSSSSSGATDSDMDGCEASPPPPLVVGPVRELQMIPTLFDIFSKEFLAPSAFLGGLHSNAGACVTSLAFECFRVLLITVMTSQSE